MNHEDVGGQQKHMTEMQLMSVYQQNVGSNGEEYRLSGIQFMIGKRKKFRELGCDVSRDSSKFLKKQAKGWSHFNFFGFHTTKA